MKLVRRRRPAPTHVLYRLYLAGLAAAVASARRELDRRP